MFYINISKKKKIVITIFFFLNLAKTAIPQSINLVPIGSFEEEVSNSKFGYCLSSNAKYWYDPTKTSSNYFNASCPCTYCSVPNNEFGNQTPKTGNSYAGTTTWINTITSPFTELKEYIGCKLKIKLKKTERTFSNHGFL